MTRHMKEFHGGAIRALQNLEHAIQSGAFDAPEPGTIMYKIWNLANETLKGDETR